MSPTPPLDALEDALAHPPHVADAGFTARVLGQLPRARRVRTLALAAGALASACAAGLILAGPLLRLVTALAAGRASSAGELLATLVAIATPLATAAFALAAEADPRPDARAS